MPVLLNTSGSGVTGWYCAPTVTVPRGSGVFDGTFPVKTTTAEEPTGKEGREHMDPLPAVEHDIPAVELAIFHDKFSICPGGTTTFRLDAAAVLGPALAIVTVAVIVDPTALTLGDRTVVTDTSAPDASATPIVVVGSR